MTPQTVIVRNGALLSAETGGTTVLTDLRTGRYFTLDPVGGRIFALLSSPMCWDDLVTELTRRYDAPRDVIARDTQQHLEQMLASGLVEVCA
jgi:hypothetical protein